MQKQVNYIKQKPLDLSFDNTLPILIIMPRFLGDAITATSALQMLHKIYPDTIFFLLARPPVAELFSSRNNMNCTVLVDERFTSTPKSLLKVAMELRKYKFQRVYHFRTSFADALLCTLAGIGQQIGYAKNGRTPLLSKAFKLDQNFHYQFRYCNLINLAHNQSSNVMPAVKLEAGQIKLPHIGHKQIAVYFGGQNKLARHYPFQLAADALTLIAAQQPCHFILLGDKSEVADNARLAEHLLRQQICLTDLTNKTSVAELVDTINSTNLVIAIDSGPMHMAAALKIPYVAVVGFGTSPWSCVEPKVQHGIHLTTNSLLLDLSKHISEIEPERIASAAALLLKAHRRL